jgi:hypothetical protein
MPVFDLRKTASRSLPTESRPLPVIEIIAGVMWLAEFSPRAWLSSQLEIDDHRHT